MATTVATRRAGGMTCGFCNTGNHAKCKVATRNGAAAPTKIFLCPCTDYHCQGKTDHPFCLECLNRHEDEINPKTWSCVDQAACRTRQHERTMSNPLMVQIIQIQEHAMTEQAAEKKVRTPAVPKVGVCLVTGEPTKGGKFKPGMDARYVSNKVQDVLAGSITEKAVIVEMQGHDLSETLQNKFTKALGLARAKVEKEKAAAKAKIEAEKAAKAEKIAKAAEAKNAARPV